MLKSKKLKEFKVVLRSKPLQSQIEVSSSNQDIPSQPEASEYSFSVDPLLPPVPAKQQVVEQ